MLRCFFLLLSRWRGQFEFGRSQHGHNLHEALRELHFANILQLPDPKFIKKCIEAILPLIERQFGVLPLIKQIKVILLNVHLDKIKQLHREQTNPTQDHLVLLLVDLEKGGWVSDRLRLRRRLHNLDLLLNTLGIIPIHI